MPDLIPAGCIAVSAAFSIFETWLWNGYPIVAELQDDWWYRNTHPVIAEELYDQRDRVARRVQAEFVLAFARGTIDALVRPPGANENFAVPANTWLEVKRPDEAFARLEIREKLGGYWDGLVGRTMFVDRSQFDSWLASRNSQRDDPASSPSPAVEALRDHLIGLAFYGLLPSARVETLAKDSGIRPLAGLPPAAGGDPLQQVRWTLAMAVSWIAWRDMDRVREAMDDFRTKGTYWARFRREVVVKGIPEPVTIEGEELLPLPPLTLAQLGLKEAANEDDDHGKLTSIRSAQEELWIRLGEGGLSATGIDADKGLIDIPPHEWSHLEVAAGEDGEDWLVRPDNLLLPAYTGITFSSQSLMEIWSGLPAEAMSELPLSTAGASDMLAQRQLLFAIDAVTPAVLFSSGIRVHGQGAALLRCLARRFEEDLAARSAKADFRYLKTRKLASELNTTEENLRRQVARVRTNLSRRFKLVLDYTLQQSEVVQNKSGLGYRLNPDLLKVDPAQLR